MSARVSGEQTGLFVSGRRCVRFGVSYETARQSVAISRTLGAAARRLAVDKFAADIIGQQTVRT